MREVECEVSKIIINERQDGQVIWLQEKGGSRTFAVIVGFFEASSLRDRVRGFNAPRPMTHNLIVNCIRDLGGKLVRVVVTELKNNTYYATLIVERDKKSIPVDARPSDALVVAMQEDVPIYVAEDVLAEASKWTMKPQVDLSIEDLEASFGEGFETEFDDDLGEFEDGEDSEDDEDDEDDEEEL